VLGTLQHRWLSQIGDVERERIETQLRSAAGRFAADFDRELTRVAMRLPRESPRRRGSPTREYARWRSGALFPDLVRDAFVARPAQTGELELSLLEPTILTDAALTDRTGFEDAREGGASRPRQRDPALAQADAGGIRRTGVPQGGATSPLLANIYLNEVDGMLERAREVTREGPYTRVQYARYADDLVILVEGHLRHAQLLRKVGRRVEGALAVLEVQPHAHPRLRELLQRVGDLDLLAPEPRFFRHDQDLERRPWLERRHQPNEPRPRGEHRAGHRIVHGHRLVDHCPALAPGIEIRVLTWRVTDFCSSVIPSWSVDFRA
jgi:hypothetical protein